MEIINLGENNSILNQFVAELRDIHIQKDRLRFRRNIERAGEIMAYEISKRFDCTWKKWNHRWELPTCDCRNKM